MPCSPQRSISFSAILLWWLLPFLLAFAAARAMEPVILLLRRTVHFKRGFSAALLTLFLLFLLGGLLSLLLSALFTEATAFLTQLPTLLDALPALTGGLLDRLRAYGALCPDWLRELLTAELSDWAAYGSTALAGLASRALALLGSMAAAVPALVLFAATTLLAVFFLAASYPTLCAAAKRRLSPRAQQRLRFWRDGVTHSLTRWLRAQAILCSLTFCQLLAGFWLLGERYSLLAAFLITLVDALPVFGTGTVLIPWAACSSCCSARCRAEPRSSSSTSARSPCAASPSRSSSPRRRGCRPSPRSWRCTSAPAPSA